jgi:transposase
MISAVLECCAGIDVGKKLLVVCVLKGPANGDAQAQIRKFGTTNAVLKEMREWLVQCGCTHVVMESTGERSFWRTRRQEGPAGTQDQPRGCALAGTSVAAWHDSSQLHSAKMYPGIAGSDPPAPADGADRSAGAQSSPKGSGRSQHQAGQCAVRSLRTIRQLMLEALMHGEASPEQIAQLAQRRVKKKIPQIQAAIEGHRMSAMQRKLIKRCSGALSRHFRAMRSRPGGKPRSVR